MTTASQVDGWVAEETGRRVAEVLATSTGGVGTHVRAVVPAVVAAGADVVVCGAAATSLCSTPEPASSTAT